MKEAACYHHSLSGGVGVTGDASPELQRSKHTHGTHAGSMMMARTVCFYCCRTPFSFILVTDDDDDHHVPVDPTLWQRAVQYYNTTACTVAN